MIRCTARPPPLRLPGACRLRFYFAPESFRALDAFPRGIRSRLRLGLALFRRAFYSPSDRKRLLRAQHSDSSPVHGGRSLVGHRVDAPGHSACHRDASRRNFPPKALRHLRTIQGWPPRADDGYAGPVQRVYVAAHVRRVRLNSLSARLNDCFLKTACATEAGRWHASSPGSVARNTSSGEPNSFSSRTDKREARPGVSASASQGKEDSGSILLRAYRYDNSIVKLLLGNLLHTV